MNNMFFLTAVSELADAALRDGEHRRRKPED
jgi:hypothetical protein